ncbi:membrane protein [Pseudomonas flexibilis]|mgnify:CR=1 FL=1|uniref:Predicted lipid-binding transport protein, Tim44 family n=1 Tax=Pseudomonas flexibilis TaxID=706570 RepID=A0A1N6YWV7_9PSED|nr:Tim44 domain-containing protein [Pseudomonas flexibilis]KHL70389.1 membrane protein [Pseudomonas flexibilis]SIR19036.1 Predicted lipid-binding transport protein, Tim44 family [Pseudomonas flexibilis]
MQRFLSIALAFCLGLTFTLDADAARLGNKKSFGSAPSHQTRQAAPAQQNQAQAPAARPGAAAPAASGASKWLGPLAGIAAGGLLAAMFMGDGFEGLQIMDMLIFGLIAFVIFKLIAARRRKALASMPQQQQYATAGAPPVMQRDVPSEAAGTNIFGQSIGAGAAAPVINAPAWFNEQRFIEQARTHFLALQQHWDAAEMDKIAEFVTPQMLAFLTQERESLGDGFQSTYIDNLSVVLDGVDDNPDKTVATLTFSGVSKTSRFDQGEAFSESWRMEREQGENQPWLLAGIRQNA